MSDYNKLMGGFKAFKATVYNEKKDALGHVFKLGIKPTTLFITCCDLKISPDTIFSGNPGELYVFRNMAAIVPPYSEEGANANGIVAAIEYGVKNLAVENVVVLGHAKCDGIKLLMSDDDESKNSSAMKGWLEIAEEARDAVKNELADKTIEEQESACEHETILVSLKNLLTYPFVEERIKNNQLKIYGWHFNIESGELMAFDPETKFFELVSC